MRPFSVTLTAALAFLCPSSLAAAQTIDLNTLQVERLGIETAEARPATALPVAELPAKVVRARSDILSLTTPFAGVVTKIAVLPGQTVAKGDLVAIVDSRDFSETRARLGEARAEARAARQAAARQKELVDAGIGAQAELDEAEARAARAEATLRELTVRLPSNASADTVRATQVLVRASADGRIDSIEAEVGETVEALEALALLSADDRLWAEIQVPARLMGQVSTADRVRFPDGQVSAIVAAPESIDPVSRSATAFTEIPEGVPAYRGALIRVQLEHAADGRDLVEVPAAAVVRFGDEHRVFSARSSGFEPVPVGLVSRTSEVAIISGDIRPGEDVVVRGLSELKALALEDIG